MGDPGKRDAVKDFRGMTASALHREFVAGLATTSWAASWAESTADAPVWSIAPA